MRAEGGGHGVFRPCRILLSCRLCACNTSNDMRPCAVGSRALLCAPGHRLSQEKDMHRKLIAACLLSWALTAAPAMAQTPAPGPTPPTPQQPGAAGGSGGSPAPTTAPEDSQGKVIGTPKEPGSTAAQSWA